MKRNLPVFPIYSPQFLFAILLSFCQHTNLKQIKIRLYFIIYEKSIFIYYIDFHVFEGYILIFRISPLRLYPASHVASVLAT